MKAIKVLAIFLIAVLFLACAADSSDNSVAGATWTQATSSAAWSARRDHSSVVYDDKIWVLGGADYDDGDGDIDIEFENDVWFSEDGRTWTQATSSAAWSARKDHTSVVFDNKIWVLGSFGGNDGDIEFENDVWLSDNGITWTQTTSSAAWSARGGHSSVVYDNKIWVLGGLDAVDDLDNDRNIEVKNDVWFSADGATWTQATSNAAWSARVGHSSVVFDNKIWVLGGFGDDNNGTLELKNDVWYLD